MTTLVALALGGLGVVMVANLLASRTRLPASVLLVAVGIAYGFVPGPNLTLEPDVVLDLVIPPLLYAAALEASLTALRSRARTVLGLSVGLVLATALMVGVGLSAATSIPLAAGVALGAAVAPPDPVASLSIGRRAGLPPRLVTLVEGEGLLNDATALTIFQVAVAATVSGTFSLPQAVGSFLVMALGGLAVGALVAWVVARIRPRLSDALVDNALSLGTPFAAYLLAEELHVSGVLAVVVAGLWLGHRGPALLGSQSRLQTRPVWRLVEFLLEGYVFLLIGQQLPTVVEGLRDYSPSTVLIAAVDTVAAVLLVRPLWLLLTSRLPARLHVRLGGDPAQGYRPLSPREVVALSWAGTRGVITLAAASALPRDFPARDLLLFCAYVVVLVTLLGQGLTFSSLLRVLRLGGGRVSAALVRNQARLAATDAALRRLDDMAEGGPALEGVIAPLRRAEEFRQKRYNDRVELLSAVEDTDEVPVDATYLTAVLVRREMIAAERQELLAWRDTGRLPDSDLRVLERELDHAESVLPSVRRT